MARAIILIPPFVKCSAGPSLGPALLQSAARMRGHDCSVVDLNANYIRPRIPDDRNRDGNFVGDHDKPNGDILGGIEREFVRDWLMPALFHSTVNYDERDRQLKHGFLTHDQVRYAGASLARSQFGVWARDLISKHVACNPGQRPQVIGLSSLHAGQVIPATALSMTVRSMWPNTLVLWGGPHVSSIGREALEKDIAEREFAADVFVVGHAEEAFCKTLDLVSHGEGRRKQIFSYPAVVGGTADASFKVVPTFESLNLCDSPLTLPAQSSVGCSFGRCAFCTYPMIEGKPARLDLASSVGSVASLAENIGASLSIKDSLATMSRLQAIAACVAGRNVQWSACTKLSHRFTLTKLLQLEKSGLTTLEVGLESLLEETQHRIGKVQSHGLFDQFVANVAATQNLSIVVNYMIGFPWEETDKALAKLRHVRSTLKEHGLGDDRARVELNRFELERLAPMANSWLASSNWK